MATSRAIFRPVGKILTLIAVLASLVGQSAAAVPTQAEALTICLKLSDSDMGAEGETFALYDVEDRLEAAISKVGTLDGHEIGGGYFTIYLSGPNAHAILEAGVPALKSALVKSGSYALLRSSKNRAESERVDLPFTRPIILKDR